MAAEPQSLKTHRRFDLWYHVILFAILGVNFFHALMHLGRHLYKDHACDFGDVWQVLMAFAFLIMFLKLRTYALKAQDRVIRLEERMRMERLLPDDLKARILELRESQLVGLRFASDGELADRVREALNEKLGNEEIKKRIQTWRADDFRV